MIQAMLSPCSIALSEVNERTPEVLVLWKPFTNDLMCQSVAQIPGIGILAIAQMPAKLEIMQSNSFVYSSKSAVEIRPPPTLPDAFQPV